MSQEPITGFAHAGRAARYWWAAAGAAVGIISVAALALRRREPEYVARWPQPAPALLASGISDLHPDAWREDGPFDVGGARNLLRPDPYHARLLAPESGGRVA